MLEYQLQLQVSVSISSDFLTPTLTMEKDYIVQGARYQIYEELGCTNAEIFSGLSIILIDSWSVIFPFISLAFYARKQLLHIYK